MIGSVTAAARTGYATTAAQTRQSATTETQTGSSGDAAKVDLSPGSKLLASLSSIILDPKVHMANAEKRLAEVMNELGIPPDTKVDIQLSSSGQFTVTGDHEKLAALQDRLNNGSERELRNSLIGAHNASIIQRIAAASQQTQQKVGANPQAAEMLWNQMLAAADRIKGQGMDFAWSGGTLSGTFADGTSLAIA
jgi:hypothetical protein